jgi:hypothetical protein
MRRRTLIAATGVAVMGSVLGRLSSASAATIWEQRWAPEANVDGLGAFEGVEDDRANSHPAGDPHIFVQDNNYRFNMHLVDRDTMTDRQRQEVKGMHADGADIIVAEGETWRWTYSMFIPGSLKATTTFTHIMQMKMPGTDSLPILTTSLQRVNGVPKIQLHVFSGDVIVGQTDLAPLQNKWIDVEFEMTVGDGTAGAVRWALHDGPTTVIDVTRSGLDTFIDDRVRPKWGIYRSIEDTSGSLQDTYLLLTKMRAYKAVAPPPPVRYEAENAARSGGTVDTNHLNFSGTGFVNTENAAGAWVEWTVNAAVAGSAGLTFRHANGTTSNRPMSLTVNGVLVTSSLAFNPTANWDTWANVPFAANLNQGSNTVRLTATTASGGPNLDYLEVQLGADQTPPPPPVAYEAENATISQGAVESNHTGFYGTGFVNYDNVTGSYVQFTVSSATAVTTTLTVRYANGTTTDRPLNIAVNGTIVRSGQSFPGTATWDSWELVMLPVSLAAGSNTIRLTATTSNGGPNLDRILIG